MILSLLYASNMAGTDVNNASVKTENYIRTQTCLKSMREIFPIFKNFTH
jgi:hypothetical protein